MLLRCALALSMATTLALGLFFGLALHPVRAEPPSPLPGRYDTPPTPPTPARDYPAPHLAEAGRPSTGASDLSIHFMSRTPRYKRYCLDYVNDVPQLCEGTADAKRFPDPGERVTFTALIANQGNITSTATVYSWRLDGGVQAVGVMPALGPGAEHELSWYWDWQPGAHTVTLWVDGASTELTTANNTLDHRTDAHYLEILVHPYFVQAFSGYRNLVGTYSFQDWLQAQAAQLNQRLAAASYPDTPDGIADRIRIDVITETVKVGGNEVVGNLAYDGRWTFRTEQDYKRTPENEARISAENYAQRYAAGIDWGLIHELAHQLGVIDLYQLNVSPSAGNKIKQDLPLLSGFIWPSPGLMGGGDIRPYDSSYFSDHTARALVTNSGYRRGYFGEYLYDLPAEVWVQVLDREGEPVPQAGITAYQTQFNVLSDETVFSGWTDDEGRIQLANRPVSHPITTATGHPLHPNPFGDIDVVGRNGQLLIGATKDEQAFFAWLPITVLNQAAWRGHDVYTVKLQTHFPHDSDLEVVNPVVRTQGNQVALEWDSPATEISYNIYRGVWPSYYPFTKIATGISTTSFSTVITTSSRFAVTTVRSDGSESGFGEIARAEMLYAPAGLAWLPASDQYPAGRVMVVDGHSGARLDLLPPDCESSACAPRWIGRIGSEHHGMVGATAAAAGPGKTVGVAIGGGQRLWVFDQDQQSINWFGRVSDRPSSLDQPAGVALLGQPFTVDYPHVRPDAGASLLLPFDGDLADPNGLQPSVAEGVSFTPGRFNQAVLIESSSRLQYPLGDFTAGRGSVEFWAKPNWPGTDKNHHVLLEIGDPERNPDSDERGYRLRLAQENGGLYVWVTDFEDINRAAWGSVVDWQPGKWHHIAAAWNEQRLSLYVDGRLLWGEALPFTIVGSPTTLAVGGSLKGEDAADAVFDSLRVSSLPRLGNSEPFRVLVSEGRRGEIKVFDLLGNRLSTFVPDDDGLHDYGQLAATTFGDVWVIDRQTRSVEQLLFDGTALHWQRTLNLPDLVDPRALALSADGILALADGDQILILDPTRSDPVLGVWSTPTDGSSDRFLHPTALAFGPNGDLAVAEQGSQRISFIDDAVQTTVLHLPVINIAR